MLSAQRQRRLRAASSCVHAFHCLSWLTRVLLVLTVSPLGTAAQTAHYTRTICRTQDGLPENIVQAVAQDRGGYLWAATTGGLARFDGARFSPLNDGTAHTLPVNGFNSL